MYTCLLVLQKLRNPDGQYEASVRSSLPSTTAIVPIPQTQNPKNKPPRQRKNTNTQNKLQSCLVIHAQLLRKAFLPNQTV